MECIQRNIQERWADSDRRFRSSEEWSFYCRSIDAYTLEKNYTLNPTMEVWKMFGRWFPLKIGWFLGFMFDSQGCKRECMFFSLAQGTTARRLVVSVSFRQHANDRILAEQKDRGPFSRCLWMPTQRLVMEMMELVQTREIFSAAPLKFTSSPLKSFPSQ